MTSQRSLAVEAAVVAPSRFDERAAADAAVKQSFGRKVRQGLAESLCVDVKAPGQLPLAGQLAAELAAGDGGAQLLPQSLELIAQFG